MTEELYVLPDGNGIELTRVVAVHYCKSYQSEYYKSKARVKLEYRGHTTNLNPLCNSALDNIAVSYVEFDSDFAAISFRDELIRLRNSKDKQ